MSELFEVRCPNIYQKGTREPIVCRTLCAKISSDSAAELVCRKCKVLFNVNINKSGEVLYIDFEQPVFEKSGKETAEDRLLALVNGSE